MKKRILKVISMLAAVLAAGIVYYLSTFVISIKCPIKRMTGFYCPGCGVTRMFLNILKLNFYKAFRCNSAVFVCLPFLALFFAMRAYGYIKTGTPLYTKPMKVMITVMTVFLLIFAVLRNIPCFSFLAPP